MHSEEDDQFHPTSRLVSVGISLGLAVTFVVVLLLSTQRAGLAIASTLAPQPSNSLHHLPSLPETTLIVATNPEWPPMEYISETQIVGYDIDLMNAIASKLSVSVEYINVDFSYIIYAMSLGIYDAAISSISITPERDEVIDYSLPYITFGGYDSVGIVVKEGDNELRHQINEALYQLRTEGTLETIVAALASDMPDWQPSLPEWPEILPDAESTLIYTNTNQSSTVIDIPQDAISDTILLVYSAVTTATASPGFVFTGHAFELDAYQDGVYSPGFTFSLPVTVTINYADLDGIGESTLRLNYWNDSTGEWEEASTTCGQTSSYERHQDEDWLAVPVCHLSKFALFGQYRTYLPIIPIQ